MSSPEAQRRYGAVVQQLRATPPELHAVASPCTSERHQLAMDTEVLLPPAASDDDERMLGVYVSTCPGHSLALTHDPCGGEGFCVTQYCCDNVVVQFTYVGKCGPDCWCGHALCLRVHGRDTIVANGCQPFQRASTRRPAGVEMERR